jgi:hypothetical protein
VKFRLTSSSASREQADSELAALSYVASKDSTHQSKFNRVEFTELAILTVSVKVGARKDSAVDRGLVKETGNELPLHPYITSNHFMGH